MAIKKKLLILLVGALSICLFFAFGFQIDVSGGISKDGGTADVSLIEPLRVAADEANAALTAAQLALEEALETLAAVLLVVGDPDALEEAEKAVEDAKEAVEAAKLLLKEAEDALLVDQTSWTTEEKEAAEQAVKDAEAALAEAEQALKDAETALAAVNLILANPQALAEAEQAVKDAEAALAEALLAADEANAAYSGLKTKDDEELEALQLAVDEAEVALKEAMEAEEVDEELIAKLELAVDDANAALEEFEPGENGIMYSHIIINSNNGGSFLDDEEGNHSGVDRDELNFTFDSKDGFDLVWLRIGNIKIEATEDILPYLERFNKKNLTIHAHFKKDKDYSPEITVEETGLEEYVEQGDENDDENGKGKDKEKSNNGKKNKNK